MRPSRVLRASMRLAASAALSVALIGLASGCTKTAPGERCAGAPGKPMVPWKGGCCVGDCVEDPSKGWGKWCPGGTGGSQGPTGKYGNGEKCQGAPGFPNVPYLGCADGLECSGAAADWGKICVPVGGGAGSSGSSGKYGEGEKCQGAPGFPNVPYLGCEDGLECSGNASDWGKICVRVGGGSGSSSSSSSSSSGGSGEGVSSGWSTLNAKGSLAKRHEATFVDGGNGKGYLVGGRGKKAINILDLASATWTNGPSTPIEMHHMQGALLNGVVYFPAVYTGGYPTEKVVDKFYTFNVGTNSWESWRAPMPGNRRRASSAVVARAGKIYVAFGSIGGHGTQARVVSWLDEYDPSSNSWRSLADAPANLARDHTGGAVVGGKFCVAGGRDGSAKDFFTAAIPGSACYNFGTGSWETKPSIPDPRSGSSYGVSCDGKMVVAGGEGFGKAFSRVDFFDGNSWSSPSFMVQARHGSGVVASCTCGNLYVPSGSGAQGGSPELSNTELYAPNGKRC